MVWDIVGWHVGLWDSLVLVVKIQQVILSVWNVRDAPLAYGIYTVLPSVLIPVQPWSLYLANSTIVCLNNLVLTRRSTDCLLIVLRLR